MVSFLRYLVHKLACHSNKPAEQPTTMGPAHKQVPVLSSARDNKLYQARMYAQHMRENEKLLDSRCDHPEFIEKNKDNNGALQEALLRNLAVIYF